MRRGICGAGLRPARLLFLAAALLTTGWASRPPQTLAAEPSEQVADRADTPWAGTRGLTVPVPWKKTRGAYPEVARKAKLGASLVMQILVRRDGSVEVEKLLGCRVWKWGKRPDEKHSRFCPELYDVVSKNIARWKYKPALHDGRPVDAYYYVTSHFYKKNAQDVWSEQELASLLPAAARAETTAEESPAEPFVRPAAGLPPDEQWRETRTAHFTVYSNASEGAALRVGIRLETLREVLRRLHTGASVRSPRPTLVYLFRNDVSFAPYTVGSNVRGYFIQAEDGNFVALHLGSGFRGALYHEYLHYFLHNNLPHVPTWLGEGMAELYSTFSVDEQTAAFGGIVAHHLALLQRSEPMPLDELFAVTRHSEEYNETERKGLFYAQSWALAHYLLIGRPELAPALGDFLERVGKGEPQQTAFTAAFGLSYEVLEQQFRDYVRSGSFASITIRFAELEVPQQGEFRVLSRAETLVVLGNLLAHADPGRLDGPERHFREALRLQPDNAGAMRGLGVVHGLHGRRDDALAALTEAARLDPEDDLTLVTHARMLLHGGMMDREQRSEAERLLRAAVALNPERADGYRLLGAALTTDGDCDEGPEVLKQAWQMMPSDLTIAVNLAALLGVCGETERATHILETFLVPYADEQQTAFARRLILAGNSRPREPAVEDERSATFREAIAAADNGEYDRALELGGRALAAIERVDSGDAGPTRELREAVTGFIEDTRAQRDWQRAFQLGRDGDPSAAIGLLEETESRIDRFLEPGPADMVRDRLEFRRLEIADLLTELWQDVLQQGVMLAVDGERERAAEIVREVIERCKDPETLASARKVLAELGP